MSYGWSISKWNVKIPVTRFEEMIVSYGGGGGWGGIGIICKHTIIHSLWAEAWAPSQTADLEMKVIKPAS